MARLGRRAASGGAMGENAWVRALAEGRQWADRSVMLGFAVATGLVVVAFTLLAEAATAAHQKLTGSSPWGPYAGLLWAPLLTVAVPVDLPDTEAGAVEADAFVDGMVNTLGL